MSKYVLGLDLGPSSVGWAAIRVNDNGDFDGFMDLPDKTPEGKPKTIPAIGVRVFPAGVDNFGQGQKEAPRNQKRRESRGMRRRLRRARGRRQRVLRLLQENGLAPTDKEAVNNLQKLDPYELRAKGVTDKLTVDEFSRIVLHIAKRRGFKSNRKGENKDDDRGKVKEGMGRLATEMGDKTLGQFWHQKLQEDRLKGIRNKGNYQWVAQRGQYREEFRRIWDWQRRMDGTIFTDDLKKRFEKLLFEQIPFELSKSKKRKVIGKCTLLQREQRCSLSERMAQEFRLRQKVNDLRVNGVELDLNQKNTLTDSLMYKKNSEIAGVRKILKLADSDVLNFEYEGSLTIPGNAIDYQLAQNKLFGKAWKKLPEETKEKIWQDILQYMKRPDLETEAQSEAEAKAFGEELEKKYSIELEQPENIRTISLPDGHVRYSKKALEWIVPKMREGMGLYQAIESVAKEAGFKQTWRVQKHLPQPDREHGVEITNPTVRTTLYEVRKVVNALIRDLGKPERIMIELPREFKADKKHRQEIIQGQTENRQIWEDCENRIREHRGWGAEVQVGAQDRIKYRLWEEQGHYCPYCGNKISISELLGGDRETDIDHILPYSMSLDNSMNNRVVCHSKCNQDKGQNTPISWLGKDSPRWQKIETALEAERFGDNVRKWERFFVLNVEISEKYTPTRLLQETSYIGREVCKYLQRLYRPEVAKDCIGTTKGVITAELRNVWELNPILREGEVGPKNRGDLRHHAIDAAITAVTTPKLLNNITRVLKEHWPQRPYQISGIPKPWINFGKDLAKAVMQVRISHHPQRKIQGALHEETNYSKENNGPHTGKYITRKALAKISKDEIDRICDEKIKELAKDRLLEFNGDVKKAFGENPLSFPNQKENAIIIKRVRLWKTSDTMFEIRNNDEEENGVWVKPDTNHHVEIFTFKGKKGREFVCYVYSMWEIAKRIAEAAKYKRKTGQLTKNLIIVGRHPDQKYAEAQFYMSLAVGDIVSMKNKDGQQVYTKITSISGKSDSPRKIEMDFKEIHVGDVQDLSKDEQRKIRQKVRIQSLSDFSKRNVRKLEADALGRFRWAEKKYWGQVD